jgi:hypothetical protein
MPIGQPDFTPGESRAERLIRKAIEAGEFEELTGTGMPLPGRGTHDDDLWWVRSWMKRNRGDDQPPSSPE